MSWLSPDYDSYKLLLKLGSDKSRTTDTYPKPDTPMSQLIYAAIIACEIAFWVVLLGGLGSRYLLGWRRLSWGLLACIPLIDLFLLAFSVIDLRQGGTATIAHGLAAIYIGASVAWGKRLINWVDERFAYWFADGSSPSKPPKTGRAHAQYERHLWGRHLLSWMIGCALLLGAVVLVGDPNRTAVLSGIASKWTLILVIDFVWSFHYTLWPKGEG